MSTIKMFSLSRIPGISLSLDEKESDWCKNFRWLPVINITSCFGRKKMIVKKSCNLKRALTVAKDVNENERNFDSNFSFKTSMNIQLKFWSSLCKAFFLMMSLLKRGENFLNFFLTTVWHIEHRIFKSFPRT